MNKIYPTKEELLNRLREIKSILYALNRDRDKLSMMISMLEKEYHVIEKLLELEVMITNELVQNSQKKDNN